MSVRAGEPIQIVDYDPAWAIDFARLRLHLLATVEDIALAVEHVGSTAVPCLAAKPILDVDVVVASVSQVQAVIARLAEIGYMHLGDLGIAGREAFASPSNTPVHHLYVIVKGSEPWRNHIQFRDYLREHAEAAEAYARLKRSLAEKFRNDRDGYTGAKTDFVDEILRKAKTTDR